MWQRVVDALGVAVRVRTDDETVAALVTGVLRSYADTPRDPALDYAIVRASESAGEPRLVRDGVSLFTADRAIDLVPAFELDLYARLVALAEGVPLHAGAVVDPRGQAVIFAGRSGAGKSTLMRTLLARGLSYASEEYVALVGHQRCRGLARALNIEDPTIAIPEGYVSDDYVLPHGRFRMFHPPERVIWRGDARALAVFAIDHGATAPDTAVRLSDGEALVALWPTMFRHAPDALAALGDALAGIPLYRLHTRTPAAAVAQVLTIARELGFDDLA